MERHTYRRKVTKGSPAQRTGVAGLQHVHGVMHAPEAEGVAACVDAGFVHELHADAAVEGGWIRGAGRRLVVADTLLGHDVMLFCYFRLTGSAVIGLQVLASASTHVSSMKQSSSSDYFPG
mmetsp:Transcript_10102/g.18199  ORF Transcript_10102/g.18199 Transcript_10102/m.18199 type:complete len:121 (+) Transcript_10102:1191-1553(+)